MEPYRRRLQLDRQELILLFCVFALISGLMFTLGLMIGYGVHSQSISNVAQQDPSDAVGRAPASAAVAVEVAAKSTKNASAQKNAVEENVGKNSLKTLTDALNQDKQKALNEKALSQTATEMKSVQDTKAHFAASPEAEKKVERTPASNDDDAPVETKEKKKAHLATERVQGLFERKPAALGKFEPIRGTYTVQVASYATEDEAKARVNALASAGFHEGYVQAIKLQNGEVWYRVAVGSFDSATWAKKSGERLVQAKLASDFVIRKIPE